MDLRECDNVEVFSHKYAIGHCKLSEHWQYVYCISYSIVSFPIAYSRPK